MRYSFIVNPQAGCGRGRAVWKRLECELNRAGVFYDVAFTTRAGEGETITEVVAPGSDIVVAVGGDGTLHEVGNGLLRTDPTPLLGWVPAGTGNDLARTLGIPRSPRQALSLLLRGAGREIDVGRVNGRYFFNVSGVGFDARVAQEVARWRRYTKGSLAYVLAALRTLPHLKAPTLELIGDGIQKTQPALLVVVGNCRYYGGGMMICPHAQEDDGRLDLCIAGNLGRFAVMRALKVAFKGKHVNMPQIHYDSVQRIEIRGPSDVLIHADGQIIGCLPARYEIVPRALRILSPPGTPHSRRLDA